MKRLDGRIAIITGGAKGIGAETARTFAAEGATVIAWDISGEAASEVAFRRTDVTDAADVGRAVDEALAQHGRIDILVNNAGIVRDAQLVKWKDGALAGQLPDVDLDLVLNVNVKGIATCARAVAPCMIRQAYGRILNASSVVGLYGNFGQTSYVASKAAVIGMTRVWARELGPRGITVNAVAPGFIGTEILRSMPEPILRGMVERTPVRRIGETRDIALAYLYLASDDASFVNGAVLSVDGGLVVGT